MSGPGVAWVVGRAVFYPPMYVFARLRVHERDRVPARGGAVLAFNHFSWIDTVAFGLACPRRIVYMAKAEAHEIPGLGQLIRAFGTFSVRRGESDRDAVRMMRKVVRDGDLLGLFVEGTRQRATGTPGAAQPGAAMVAIQEGVPVVPAAVRGSLEWRFGNFRRISVLWGEPMRFDGLPRNSRGYREATAEIERAIHRLWSSLGELERQGTRRPGAVP